MAYKFFDKTFSATRANKVGSSGVMSELMPNQELATELHKPVIRKLEKRKIELSFKDNICGADLPDMQLISKFNKEFRFLLCVIDIYSKHAWVFPLKAKAVLQWLILFK